jgi:hypothetical protein
MDDLLEGMHAGVSAPGTHRRNRLAGDVRERGLEMVLDTAAGGLGLPAAKRRPIVFDAERYSYGIRRNRRRSFASLGRPAPKAARYKK